jgi:translocation and assembly module TamB
MDLTATLRQRAADLRLRLSSRALAVAVEGGVDLAHNRYQGLRVAARLLEPGAIAPNLAGRDVQLAMVLNGAFASPRVAYELSAARLAFGTTVVQGLAARGAATVDADQVMIPVAARAQRILGFDSLAGGTIANVALDGTLGVTWPRLVSENLRLRSDRIDATLALAFDFAKGRYLAAVQGRVNHYLVHGVGLFDVTTNLDLTNSGGGFGLSGRVAARSRRIDNAAAAGLLGGAARASANVAMDSNGVIRIDTIRLAAPQLRIREGGGTYHPNGAIDIRVAGASTAYGPLAVHVTGTVAAPQIAIRAARPGLASVSPT